MKLSNGCLKYTCVMFGSCSLLELSSDEISVCVGKKCMKDDLYFDTDSINGVIKRVDLIEQNEMSNG
jgi:hypothetical protein